MTAFYGAGPGWYADDAWVIWLLVLIVLIWAFAPGW